MNFRFYFTILTLLTTIWACRSIGSKNLDAGTQPEQNHVLPQARHFKDVYDHTMHFNQQMRRLYEARQSKAYKIKTATFNTGLLHATLLQYLGATVPFYDTRRQHLKKEFKEFLGKNNPIFVCLQEVFYPGDVKLFEEIASQNGYQALRFENSKDTGLMLLYRKNNLQPTHSGAYPVMPFDVVVEEEIVVDRSIMGAMFWIDNQTEEGIKVIVASAHLSYGPGLEKNARRLQQIDEITDLLKSKASRFDVDAVILGGDFNLSPLVGDRTYETGQGVLMSDTIISDWFENTKGYVNFYNHMRGLRMMDTWYAANPLPETMAREFVVPDDSDQRQVVGFTEDPVTSYLTRTGPTTKEEPAQRIDYVWVGTRSRSDKPPLLTHVLNSQIVFDQPLKGENGSTVLVDENQPLHLSDHFGVLSEVALFR